MQYASSAAIGIVDPNPNATIDAFAVREAWDILGDEKLRAAYDTPLANPIPDTSTAPRSRRNRS